MPALVLVLLQGFYLVVSSVVGQWLFGLGVGIAAYTGISALLSNVNTFVASQAAGVSSSVMTFRL